MMRLAAAVVAMALAGCGGNFSQPAARDVATKHSCDWYQKCGEISSGKTYATRDACEVDIRKYWDGAWPLAACDGKITPTDLDVCLKGIDSTVCGNGFDYLNTLLNKCSRTQVCKGGSACGSGNSCGAGTVCVNATCQQLACNASSPCPNPYACSNGFCQ